MYKTGRVGFRMVEATLDAMNYCRNLDYDYFLLLSGQCYPIKPLRVIKQELEKKNVAFIEYFKLPSTVHWVHEQGGLDRIKYYTIYLGKQELPIRIPRLNRNLPYHLEPYGGSYWSCLPKRFVDYVLDYVSNHPKIVNFYKYCHMPGEMFFQTIIMNSALKCDVVNDDRRYIPWPSSPAEPGGHPAILRKEDFNQIMRSGKLFARKFDATIDNDILDLIDGEIQQDRSVGQI